MLIQQNILGSDWDLIKYRFAEKILSEGEDSRYLMIFGGSSVTAGHDNGVNNSYPLVVYYRMKNALEAAGIEMKVHNIAQGANNCLPSNFCYESMGGHDPDFIGWEQSFNCGHDGKVFELAARFAAWSKTPGSIYYSNSGSSNPKNCKPSEFKKPWSDSDWSPEMEGLPAWKPTREDVKYWKERNNFAHTHSGSTSSRFGGKNYVYREYGLAVLGSDMWNKYKPEQMCADAPEMAGLPCCPEVFYSKCLLKMMRKEASKYGKGKGAPHHPSKGVHQVRGELIAYLYSLIYLDALYEVRDSISEAIGGGSDSIHSISRSLAKEQKEKFSNERGKLVKTTKLRKPVSCGSYYCHTKPYCHTDYRSHFSEDLFLSQQLVGNVTWKTKGVTIPAVADTQFLERRGGWGSKDPNDGGLHMKIKIGSTKFVVVCFYHTPHADLAMEYYVELNVAPERLNENYVPDKDKVVNWEHDVVTEWGVCQKVHNLPEGQHVLGIRYKDNEKKASAGISHLITWD